MGLPGCLFVCHLILLLMCFLFNLIPDCIRYISGVFCYKFKSQTSILASY